MQVSSFHFGPHKTPRSIKGLILAIAAISLLSPLLTFFLHYFFQMYGPQDFFPLSLHGILTGKIWQFFTYFFIQSTDVHISLSLLFSLGFLLFLLWFAGSEIALRFGNSKFFFLFLSAGIFAGLTTTLFLYLFSSSTLVYGSSPAVFSLLVVWTLLHRDLDLYFFFFIRLKAKWLVALVLGISLIISLSHGAFFSFIADVAGILWGYFFGWIFFKLSPLFLIKKRSHFHSNGKIIDITEIKKNDNFFMDAMLDKIAKKGEASLSEKEKKRMKEISKRKQKEFYTQ